MRLQLREHGQPGLCHTRHSGGGGGGGTKSKGDDLAEFKRDLLAEVRNTIKIASVAPSGPTSRRNSTVESDVSKGSEGQSTLATRERLDSEIHELRKLLGPDPSTTATVAHEDPGWATSPREGHQESRVAAERVGQGRGANAHGPREA